MSSANFIHYPKHSKSIEYILDVCIIFKIVSAYSWARDERVIIITIYWKVTFSYFGKEEERIFMGRIPSPLYGTGQRARQINAYTGISLSGAPQVFRVEGHLQPEITVKKLGERPPLFSPSQKFKMKGGGATEYCLVEVAWKHNGWWYLLKPISSRSSKKPRWMSEDVLRPQAKLLSA